MNVFDKMVEVVSPETAMKRQKARGILAIRDAQLDNLDRFMNSGYSNGGASRRKRFAKNGNLQVVLPNVISKRIVKSFVRGRVI